ncbi:MAG: S8 family peptidase [Massilia sp.]
MNVLRRLLCAVLAALLAVVVQPALPADPAQPATAASAPQLLVMLRMPPQHFHPDGYGAAYPNDTGKAMRRRAAEAVAGRHGLRLVDSWPMPAIGVDCYVMQASDGKLQQALADLARDEGVLWAQPVNEFHGLDGGDPLLALQPAARSWHISDLHKSSRGRGVRVALIDSAVDASHPDLTGQIETAVDFVERGPMQPEPHGTAVAGIIVARENNGVGIAGVAPAAKLMVLRACWGERATDTRCNTFTLGKALNFALTHQANIINLSLGGPPDPLLQALLDAALRRGMSVVAAADALHADGAFPASHPGVLAVGAEGQLTRGGAMLAAPGADIPTSLPGMRWGLVSGSSYAAAHVSGLLALMLELSPNASPAQLRAGIVEKRGGTRALAALAGPGGGTGNIDACATIGRLSRACACLCPATSTPASPSSATAAAR